MSLTKEQVKELEADNINVEAVKINIKNGKQEIIETGKGLKIIPIVERGLGGLENLVNKNFNYDEHIKIINFFKCFENYLFVLEDNNYSSPSFEGGGNTITENLKDKAMAIKFDNSKKEYQNARLFVSFAESLNNEESEILYDIIIIYKGVKYNSIKSVSTVKNKSPSRYAKKILKLLKKVIDKLGTLI